MIAGHNLLYLRARATAAQQVQQVAGAGWGPTQKQTIIVPAQADSRGGVDTDPIRHRGVPRRTNAMAPFPELTTQAECELVAASVAERIAATFGYAEGEAIGDPRLRAGVAVSFGRTGRFDGKYTLTSTRHVFDRRGYHTEFRVSGDHDRTLYGLPAEGTRHASASPGVVNAIVTNVNDPRQLGRVKVAFPWLADDYESNWAGWCRSAPERTGGSCGSLKLTTKCWSRSCTERTRSRA